MVGPRSRCITFLDEWVSGCNDWRTVCDERSFCFMFSGVGFYWNSFGFFVLIWDGTFWLMGGFVRSCNLFVHFLIFFSCTPLLIRCFGSHYDCGNCLCLLVKSVLNLVGYFGWCRVGLCFVDQTQCLFYFDFSCHCVVFD